MAHGQQSDDALCGGSNRRNVRRRRPAAVAGLGALLGYLVTVMAMVALVSPVTGDARLLVWPGAVVLGAGAIVAALASAFYYHFAAWGAVEMADR